MREEFNLRKSRKLEEINRRGKTEASKTVIEALATEIADLQQKKETAESLQKAAEMRAERLAEKRITPTPYESTEQYARLTAQIAEIEAKIADEGKCTTEAVGAVEAKIRATDDAIREERDKQMQLTMAENQQRRIGELEKQEKRLAAEFEELEKGLYLCDLFTKAKVSALTERINGKFKSVRFRLFVEQLNGGLKEDCEVMIPRANGDLVPYTFANNAARINAGLEIINTLAEHWDIRMPVFIDNAESVTRLTESDTQTIRLVVSEADEKLRLEVEDNADIFYFFFILLFLLGFPFLSTCSLDVAFSSAISVSESFLSSFASVASSRLTISNSDDASACSTCIGYADNKIIPISSRASGVKMQGAFSSAFKASSIMCAVLISSSAVFSVAV